MNRTNSRYLDVLTFRPSEGRTVKQSENSILLVDPVILPELHHLQIDRLNEVSDKECLFYPTGHKNKNMKRQMEESIRQYKTTGDIHLKSKTKTFVKSFGLKQKELSQSNLMATRGNTKPRQTLFYTRPSDPSTNECKKLIQGCRNNEERMDDILGVKVTGLDVCKKLFILLILYLNKIIILLIQ
jgi:hypothetical protein